MALHEVLNEHLVTKQNLIDQNFKINKKFVMIDSRAYNQEAFEYVLKLADYAGSIVFVYDQKKIWANGQYFGGDVFENDLNYFTKFITTDETGKTTGETYAISPKANMIFTGKSHVKTEAIFKPDDYYNNIITFDYDLESAVNTNYVTIGGVRYNLVVENDQIRLNEYIPLKVTCSSLPPIEYDSVAVNEMAEISFRITLSGTNAKNPQVITIDITCNNEGVEIRQDPNENIIYARIPRNTDVTFTLKYNDKVTEGTTSVTQKWGYGIWTGVYDEGEYGNLIEDNIGGNVAVLTDFNGDRNGILGLSKTLWVPGTSFSMQKTINQNQVQYGLVIVPAEFNMEFTDVSTNLSGGWTPLFEKLGPLYENMLPYMVYRTDHKGLGSVTWKLKG